jgi:hypothetical protein
MALHVLASAHAEKGEFAQAVRWQQKALAMLPASQKHDRAIVQAALKQFEAGRPYREFADFE